MKPTVIDPKTTSRAEAYDLWMNAPNPMVTFFKTLDVTPLYRLSRRRELLQYDSTNSISMGPLGESYSALMNFVPRSYRVSRTPQEAERDSAYPLPSS